MIGDLEAAFLRACPSFEGPLKRLREDNKLFGADLPAELPEIVDKLGFHLGSTAKEVPTQEMVQVLKVVERVLKSYLAPCEVLVSQGRSFPVRVEYLPKAVSFEDEPVWDVAARECERVAGETSGDMLVFMPGAYEISRTVQAIQGIRSLRDFVTFPLHGELPPDQQDRAVARYDARKVIVSTNVAETSITIDGGVAVIDSGLARVASHSPWSGLPRLRVQPRQSEAHVALTEWIERRPQEAAIDGGLRGILFTVTLGCMGHLCRAEIRRRRDVANLRRFAWPERGARATAAECNNAPIFRADLERVAEIRAMFDQVSERFGRLDGLVNNAARFTTIDPLTIEEADWDFIHSERRQRSPRNLSKAGLAAPTADIATVTLAT